MVLASLGEKKLRKREMADKQQQTNKKQLTNNNQSYFLGNTFGIHACF